MFACTASWSTEDLRPFFPFLRPPPFSASGPKLRPRSPVTGAPGTPEPEPRCGGPEPRCGGPEPRWPGADGALLLNTGRGRDGPVGRPPWGAAARGTRVGITG